MFLDRKLDDQSSRLNGSTHTHSSTYVLRACTFHLFEQFVFLLYAYMAQRGTISLSRLNHLKLELYAWCTLHKTQFKWSTLLCIYYAKTLSTFLFLNMSLQVVLSTKGLIAMPHTVHVINVIHCKIVTPIWRPAQQPSATALFPWRGVTSRRWR